MTAPLITDRTGAQFLTTTVAAAAILTYTGPGGTFPAGSIVVLEVIVVAYDATAGGKSFYVYEVGVTNIGGTLVLVSAASPTARSTAVTGTSQASGATFSVSGSTLAVLEARTQTGNSLQWAAAIVSANCLTP